MSDTQVVKVCETVLAAPGAYYTALFLYHFVCAMVGMSDEEQE